MSGSALDASKYQTELGTLALLLIKQIEREWPRDRLDEAPGATALLVTLQMALRYWNAEHFLAYTSENPTPGWGQEHCLILPLVDRTLLEMACNVIFLCEDLASRGIWFLRSGWREAKLEWYRLDLEYGADPSLEWANYLSQTKAHLESGMSRLGITEEQSLNPSELTAWPKIGSLQDYGSSPNLPLKEMTDTRRVIRQLRDWFYPELSSIAHSNGYAQLLQGALAGGMSQSSSDRAVLRESVAPLQQSRSLFRSSMFLLCVVSEVQLALGYEGLTVRARLLHVWELLSTQGEVKDVFDLRYARLYDLPLVGGSEPGAPPLRS